MTAEPRDWTCSTPPVFPVPLHVLLLHGEHLDRTAGPRPADPDGSGCRVRAELPVRLDCVLAYLGRCRRLRLPDTKNVVLLSKTV